MAKNKGKITDVVEVDAVKKQIDFLKGGLDGIINQFVALAKQIDQANDSLKGLKSLNEISKALKSQEQATKQAEVAAKNYNSVQAQLAKKQMELAQIQNGGAAAFKEQAVVAEKLRQEKKKLTDQAKAQVEAEKQSVQSVDQLIAGAKRENDSIKALRDENAKLLKIRNSLDTNKQKAEIDKINKVIDKNTETIRGNADAATKQKMNIGNYGSALEGLPGPIGRATTGVKSFGKQLWALMANPIVAIIAGIVLVFTSLYKIIKSTDDGATMLDGIFKSVSAIFDVLKRRALGLIGAFKALFSGNFSEAGAKFKESVSGLGEELANAAKKAFDLAYALDALNDRIIGNISKEADLRLEIEKQMQLSKDRTKSDQERLTALESAIRLERELANDKKMYAQQTYQLAIEEAALKAGANEDDIKYLISLDGQQAEAARKMEKYKGIWNVIGDDGIKALEESYKAMVDADMEYFRKTQRTISQLSGLKENLANESSKTEADIVKKHQETTLNLMDDGFTKELQKIRYNYKQQIDEIDEKLRTENKLTINQIIALNETKSNILRIQAKEEEALIEKTEKERASTQEKLLKERLIELEQSFDTHTKAALFASEKQKQAELDALRQKLNQQLITSEQYEQQAKDIEKKYADESIKIAIEEAAKKIETLKAMGADTADAEKTLFDLKKTLGEQETANYLDNLKKQEDADKEAKGKALEREKELASKKEELVEELTQSIISIANSSFEANAMKLDEEAARDEEAKQRELHRAGNNAALKEQIEARYAAKEKQRDQERRRLEIQQAKFNKQAAMVQIAMDTAKAIMKIWAEVPKADFGASTIALTAITGAIGAMQLAAVAAQPLPQYFRGRDGGPAEYAMVGERGTEAVVMPSGEAFLTPDRPTLTFLPEHASVIPNIDLMKFASKASMQQVPVMERRDSGYMELKKEFRALQKGFDRVVSAVENKKELHLNITEKGFHAAAKRGHDINRYITKNIRF